MNKKQKGRYLLFRDNNPLYKNLILKSVVVKPHQNSTPSIISLQDILLHCQKVQFLL